MIVHKGGDIRFMNVLTADNMRAGVEAAEIDSTGLNTAGVYNAVLVGGSVNALPMLVNSLPMLVDSQP